MSTLKIGLQKSGRLAEESLMLLKKAGFEFDRFDHSLISRVTNFDIDILFLRESDIPEYVQDGICDLGICGYNTVIEKKAEVPVIQKLTFGFCQLVIAVPKRSKIKSLFDLNNCRIATSYPTTLDKFLETKRIKAQVVEIRGSVEIAPSLKIAEAICDLVSTGNTLAMNGLRVLSKVLSSEAVLISSKKKNSPNFAALIDKVMLRIKGCLAASGQKYLMMNAPKKSLKKLSSLIPSLKSPTIVPLKDPSMIAIHSVVPETIVWKVVEKLKDNGASGILVLPIEAIIP